MKKGEEDSCFLKSSLYRAVTSSVAPIGAAAPLVLVEGTENLTH